MDPYGCKVLIWLWKVSYVHLIPRIRAKLILVFHAFAYVEEFLNCMGMRSFRKWLSLDGGRRWRGTFSKIWSLYSCAFCLIPSTLLAQKRVQEIFFKTKWDKHIQWVWLKWCQTQKRSLVSWGQNSTSWAPNGFQAGWSSPRKEWASATSQMRC